MIGFGFQVDSIAFSPVSGVLDLGILSLPVTVLWIVGMTSAFNLIDGVDGLAGTMETIALTVSIGVGIFLLPAGGILIPTAVLGAIFGFLRFNTSPAGIFLGDSGSMTLGFLLYVSRVLRSTSQETGATYAAIPLFALAFPLLDTFIAMARRWLRGHPFSRADGRRVHHQLLGLGLTAQQTVDLLGIFFFATAGLGVSLVFAPPRFTVALILASAVLGFAAIFYGTRWLRYGEFAELGASVLSVFRNARLVVREKIRANEIAEEIRSADSLEDVREILASLVDDVRLLDVEIVAGEVRFHGPERQQISPLDDLPIRLDYPVAYEVDGAALREVVLRLWSRRPHAGLHPASERVAVRVGPALEEWLRRNPVVIASAVESTVWNSARRTPSVGMRTDR